MYYHLTNDSGKWEVFDIIGRSPTLEELWNIVNDIIYFIDTEGENIEKRNKEIDENFEKGMCGSSGVKRPKVERAIYFFECNKKYKIGVAKDVGRRFMELNNRPFPLKVLAVSKHTSEAFGIEQAMHKEFERYRVDGEWYDFEQSTVDEIIKRINAIEGKKNGDN